MADPSPPAGPSDRAGQVPSDQSPKQCEETAQYARFLELHALASSPERHRVPLATLEEYQRLLAKFGVFKVDDIFVGPPDPTRMPNAEPILNTDCIPISGTKPRVCPRSAPKLPVELVSQVEARFRSLRLVGPDQTVLWVGRQARMDTLCMYRDGCNCFTESAPPATKPQPVPVAKRSTTRGDGRAKLIAALTKHHRYADESCLNQEPIGNNDLAKMADVSPSTASAFFNEKFKGYTKYKALCRDLGGLVTALKLLNNEFAPHNLYDHLPADEGDKGNLK